VPPESTVHLQSNPRPRGYTLLSLSLRSQCAASRSHDGITDILGLPEHVVSCKVSTKRDYNRRSLTDTIGDTTVGLFSRCKSTDRSQINIIIHSFSCFTTTLQTLLNIFKVFLFSKAKQTKHFQIKQQQG
jgi:hypothetical protein